MQISLFALSLVLAALAIFVWRARSDSAVNRWFAAFTISVASWVCGVAGLQTGAHLDAWGRFTFASASLIPATFLAFIRSYPVPSDSPPRALTRATLFIATILASLSLATPLMVYDNALTESGLVRKTGPLYPVFSLYFLSGWAAAIYIFILKWRQSRGLARAQLQHLGVGVLFSGIGAISVNLIFPFATGRSTYSWIGPYFSLLLVAMIGHAIIRHRLMDLRLVIHRGLAYAFTMAFVSAVVIVFGRLTVPTWQVRHFAMHLDVLTIVIVTLAMLSTPAQRLVSRLIDPYLYRGRIEYSSALRQATHRLSRLMQPTELCAELRHILTDAFVPESFTMVVRPLTGGALEQLTADTQSAADLFTIAALLSDEPNPSLLVVNPSREIGSKKVAHEALRTAGIEIVMKLGRRGQLLGAVLLGPRRSGNAYFTEDLAFIESLAELASIALENALLYRQRIQMLDYSDRLLESLDSAVVAVDVIGKITSFNPAAKALLGLNDHSQGAQLDILPSEIGWALAIAISGSWRPSEVEVLIDHESRGLLPVILSTAVLHDDGQRVAGALVVVTDLSTIKALEHHQRRIEHFALMARFYAGIAHEIRSPLAAISNFIAMLPDRFDDPEYRDTAIRLLPIEVNRIVHLADRLRLMAPSEGAKLTTVSLPPLLSDIVAIHAPAARDRAVTLQLNCPSDLPKILGDPSQLVQLFVNLLKNAVEAMPDGGGVSMEATHHPSRSLSDRIIVRIIDDGIGIQPSVRGKIFEPFFTTKASGTGLGLSICREIADFHRARLTLLPRINGRGTIAQIEFPCVAIGTTNDETRSGATPTTNRAL